MGLNGWLAARAVRSTQVLLVECQGAWAGRVAAERSAVQRGWRLAQSPASADVLVVAGRPTGELADVVARLWDAMPGPRSRVDVRAREDVVSALDEAVRQLGDATAQAKDAASRATCVAAEEEHAGPEGMRPGGMDHSEMDHGGPEGMDHGDMEMAPDGIPLAEGSGDDRDGLEMDSLPVRLGPVLPHWPAGLVLDVMLHGDLVTRASARFVDSDGGGHLGGTAVAGEDGDVAARACDDVASVLDLAGWSDGAAHARSVRDALLDGCDDRSIVAIADLKRRVAASRLLRWSLRGTGLLTAERTHELGLADHLVGDCLDRLLGLLDRAESGATAPVPVSAVGPLILGCDLGVARLVVASLGALEAPAEVSGGA